MLLQKLRDLPLELLEMVLMRSFLMFYMLGKSRSAERRALTRLASVCSYWHLTLTGWPDSPTGQWVRHQMRKRIEREYFILFCLAHLDL